MDRLKQGTPPTALRQAVPFDTLSVRVYDEVRQSSPTLGRTQAQYVLVAVLRHLYRATGGHLATAAVSLDQGALAQEVQLSRQWLGVLLTRDLSQVFPSETFRYALFLGMRGIRWRSQA